MPRCLDQTEPVLLAAYRQLRDADKTTPEAVCEELGHPPNHESTLRALALLYEDDYIGGWKVENHDWPMFIESKPKGLRYTSGWPDENKGSAEIELLLKLLTERIESDTVPEEDKGRLRQIRDGVATTSRDVLVEIAGAYVARMTGASG